MYAWNLCVPSSPVEGVSLVETSPPDHQQQRVASMAEKATDKIPRLHLCLPCMGRV